ncbi:MAG: stretch-activated cation channel mid1 [Candelina submexicana]|nr:MAG: stretch-activated cation channel mid1 [Candelina submexicana]
MPLPKLTTLQSRLAASFAASLILITDYIWCSNPYFAYAANGIGSIDSEDHNHRLSFELYAQTEATELSDWHNGEESETYEPSFAGLDRSIIGRAPDGIEDLPNNTPGKLNINPGETQYWTVSNATLWGTLSSHVPGLRSSMKGKREDGRILGDAEGIWDDLGNAYADRDWPIDLQRRQNTAANQRTLYITLNTCLQPVSNVPGKGSAPPQLQLYISQSPNNQKPGPGTAESGRQSFVIADGGFASIPVNATADIYIGVEAPAAPGFTDHYNYELAASIDAPYHSLNSRDSNLHLIDSDTNSALFITSDLTNTEPDDPVYKKWVSSPPPFIIFAHNQNDTAISGLQNSFCGLKNKAQIAAFKDGSNTHNVEVGITTNRGLGNKPKEQFYITSLNGSSAYYGFLAVQGNSTAEGAGVIGGGGKLWKPTNFETKSDGNCQVIFNLTFCSEVAYAVPSNPRTLPNITDLKRLYDDNALALYKNFSYSLQQIACDTTSSARYSLVRDCADCAHAYKQWLCAVAIPRCHDFSSDLPFLQPRNIAQEFINKTTLDPMRTEANSTDMAAMYANRSRNALIDTKVRPGPYKEVLPCRDLCYSLVQSCPAALGFACPSERMGLNRSYGVRGPSGNITCSFLGAAYYQNAATTADTLGLSYIATATISALWLLSR